MKELKLKGGAKIGMWSSSYPFAHLKVNKDRLELNASMIGNLVFQPSDIVDLEPSSGFSLIGGRIRIRHNVADYKEKVIFYSMKEPKEVIGLIKKTGFRFGTSSIENTPSKEIQDRQKSGGFPVKIGFAVFFIVLWNVLFLIDLLPFFFGQSEGFPIGKYSISALAILFLSSILSLVSNGFRAMILKEGRNLNDIKSFAIFSALISGVLVFNMIIMMELNK
ncbi:MAG: hypothetical protein WBG42_01620 [Cryomorphaceae bacterium]